jgi:hypothetical protein
VAQIPRRSALEMTLCENWNGRPLALGFPIDNQISYQMSR